MTELPKGIKEVPTEKDIAVTELSAIKDALIDLMNQVNQVLEELNELKQYREQA